MTISIQALNTTRFGYIGKRHSDATPEADPPKKPAPPAISAEDDEAVEYIVDDEPTFGGRILKTLLIGVLALVGSAGVVGGGYYLFSNLNHSTTERTVDPAREQAIQKYQAALAKLCPPKTAEQKKIQMIKIDDDSTVNEIKEATMQANWQADARGCTNTNSPSNNATADTPANTDALPQASPGSNPVAAIPTPAVITDPGYAGTSTTESPSYQLDAEDAKAVMDGTMTMDDAIAKAKKAQKAAGKQ